MLSRWLLPKIACMTGRNCPVVMGASHCKLFLNYVISDQTGRNCVLIVPGQEIALIPEIMKMKEKKVTWKLHTYWNENFRSPPFFPLFLLSFMFLSNQDLMTSQLLCVIINVTLLLHVYGNFWAIPQRHGGTLPVCGCILMLSPHLCWVRGAVSASQSPGDGLCCNQSSNTAVSWQRKSDVTRGEKKKSSPKIANHWDKIQNLLKLPLTSKPFCSFLERTASLTTWLAPLWVTILHSESCNTNF